MWCCGYSAWDPAFGAEVYWNVPAQNDPATRQLIVYGVIGIIFFFSGIGLVKNTKDEA
jgi:hypothetical protein